MEQSRPNTYWNYRVLRHEHDMGEGAPSQFEFDIREVYYEDGVAHSTTVNSMAPYGESPEELFKNLQMMLSACDRPVIDGDNFPNEL